MICSRLVFPDFGALSCIPRNATGAHGHYLMAAGASQMRLPKYPHECQLEVLQKGFVMLVKRDLGLIEGRLRADPHKNYLAVSTFCGCLCKKPRTTWGLSWAS